MGLNDVLLGMGEIVNETTDFITKVNDDLVRERQSALERYLVGYELDKLCSKSSVPLTVEERFLLSVAATSYFAPLQVELSPEATRSYNNQLYAVSGIAQSRNHPYKTLIENFAKDTASGAVKHSAKKVDELFLYEVTSAKMLVDLLFGKEKKNE